MQAVYVLCLTNNTPWNPQGVNVRLMRRQNVSSVYFDKVKEAALHKYVGEVFTGPNNYRATPSQGVGPAQGPSLATLYSKQLPAATT